MMMLVMILMMMMMVMMMMVMMIVMVVMMMAVRRGLVVAAFLVARPVIVGRCPSCLIDSSALHGRLMPFHVRLIFFAFQLISFLID